MSLFTYKLKRELSRIKQQLKAIPEFFYEPLIRFQHDRLRSKTLIPNDGAIENKKNKIAIFSKQGLRTVGCQQRTNRPRQQERDLRCQLEDNRKAELRLRFWRLPRWDMVITKIKQPSRPPTDIKWQLLVSSLWRRHSPGEYGSGRGGVRRSFRARPHPGQSKRTTQKETFFWLMFLAF